MSMPSGDWSNFDEIPPRLRARCVCGAALKRGGGVRICPKCKRRFWVHVVKIVEVDRDVKWRD